MSDPALLLTLFLHFLLLSLLAIGGAVTVVPDMHRLLVGELGVLSDAQFTASIAIAQAAPGPNVLFVAVMGWQAAGAAGLAATLLGILLPSATLALAAHRWGEAHRRWRPLQAFRAGMAPIVIGLMLATGWILAAEAPGRGHWFVTGAAALLVWRTRIHLLWLVAAGGLMGALGWV
jgi:chromate transporter